MPTDLLTKWIDSVAASPWTVIVTGVVVAAVGLLYARGLAYQASTGIGRPVGPLQGIAFYAGLLIFALAVASPLDTWADASLPAHMVQHIALIFFVAPLLLIGAPIWPVWRALPRRFRRSLLRWFLERRWARNIGTRVGVILDRPVGAWVIFVVTLLFWHIPFFYDLALEHNSVHAVEHITFLATACVFWAQVIPSFPLRPALSYAFRAVYLIGAGMVLHLLAVVISIAARPIYSYYGTGDQVVAQQSAAGAFMDVSGQLVFTIAIMICVWFWLRDDEKRTLESAEDVPEPEVAPAMTASGALLMAEAELVETAGQSNVTGE